VRKRDAAEEDSREIPEAHTCALPSRTATAGTGPVTAEGWLFEGLGFERWAHLPKKMAEPDGVERDAVVLGLRVDEALGGSR
jgi:L-amino acid N-acyltransferase YncA